MKHLIRQWALTLLESDALNRLEVEFVTAEKRGDF